MSTTNTNDNLNILDELNKAKIYGIGLCNNGLYYVVPEYKFILKDYGINKNNEISWDDIFEVLKLEVERLNSMDDRGPYIKNIIYEIIYSDKTESVKDDIELDILKYVKPKIKPEDNNEKYNKYNITPIDYSAR